MLSSFDVRGRTVLALHAHPDDEAIFTGITLRRLADAGARVVLVVATAGELGESRVPLERGRTVAQQRITEVERSAAELGVARLVLLGQRDSGLPGWASGAHPRALAAADPDRLARRIARLVEAESADTMIYDDEQGIYGHPDHRATHRIGATAATMVRADSYRVTVDRERLHHHGPGRHLVQGAARSAGVGFGRTSDEITLTVTGEPDTVARKYAAVTAHASQIDAATLPGNDFASVYGTEWFRHDGPPGLLHLCNRPPRPDAP